MPLYRVDTRICATAYVKADTAEEALEVVRQLEGLGLELKEQGRCDVPITGALFDDDDLPDVSLSPAMTISGLDEDAIADLVE